jgi:hypothetical protein
MFSNMEQGAEFQKALAVFNVAMSSAQSIAGAIQGAIQSATATGAGAVAFTPIFIAQQVATVLGAFGQIYGILSQPEPSAPRFATGVEYLHGAGTTTSDSIPAWLSRGERVVTADKNKQYFDELSAIHRGNFESFVRKKYVIPAIGDALKSVDELQRGMVAGQIANQLIGGKNWKGDNIVNELMRNRSNDREMNQQLIKAITKSSRISKRKF